TKAELDGLGRAGFRAGRPEAVVDAVVAERALLRGAGLLVERDHAERARRHAIAATVADVLVDVDRAVLGPVDRARRTGVEAAGLGAMLADVGHEQPRQVAARFRLFDEANEPERLVREVMVILIRARPLGHFLAQLVPLLARHLAGPAADAQGRVREHRQSAGHDYTTPFFTLQTKALVSWM